MKYFYCLFLILCTIQMAIGQNVGINTTNPTATLDVAGDFKFIPDVTTVTTRLIATSTSGDVFEYPLSAGFDIVNDTLVVTDIIDSNILLVGYFDQSPTADIIDSWDNMDLGLTSYNEYNTIIHVSGETAGYDVTGFISGITGRVFYFYNAQSHNMTFKNLSSSSDSQNQILTGTGGDESIAAEGVAEFIYDPTLQKWILINIRS